MRKLFLKKTFLLVIILVLPGLQTIYAAAENKIIVKRRINLTVSTMENGWYPAGKMYCTKDPQDIIVIKENLDLVVRNLNKYPKNICALINLQTMKKIKNEVVKKKRFFDNYIEDLEDISALSKDPGLRIKKMIFLTDLSVCFNRSTMATEGLQKITVHDNSEVFIDLEGFLPKSKAYYDMMSNFYKEVSATIDEPTALPGGPGAKRKHDRFKIAPVKYSKMINRDMQCKLISFKHTWKRLRTFMSAYKTFIKARNKELEINEVEKLKQGLENTDELMDGVSHKKRHTSFGYDAI